MGGLTLVLASCVLMLAVTCFATDTDSGSSSSPVVSYWNFGNDNAHHMTPQGGESGSYANSFKSGSSSGSESYVSSETSSDEEPPETTAAPAPTTTPAPAPAQPVSTPAPTASSSSFSVSEVASATSSSSSFFVAPTTPPPSPVGATIPPAIGGIVYVRGRFKLSGTMYGIILLDSVLTALLKVALRIDLSRLFAIHIKFIRIASMVEGSLIVEYELTTSEISAAEANSAVANADKNGGFSSTQTMYSNSTGSNETIGVLESSAEEGSQRNPSACGLALAGRDCVIVVIVACVTFVVLLIAMVVMCIKAYFRRQRKAEDEWESMCMEAQNREDRKALNAPTYEDQTNPIPEAVGSATKEPYHEPYHEQQQDWSQQDMSPPPTGDQQDPWSNWEGNNNNQDGQQQWQNNHVVL